MIWGDELTRCASIGASCLLTEGIVLGIPPVMAFGSEKLKQKYVKQIIQGEKIICLAITGLIKINIKNQLLALM